jgi:hypothetical protein
VTQTASLSLADRLKLIIEGLCQAIARRVGLGGLAGPLIVLIWTHLRRLSSRFAYATATLYRPSRPRPNRLRRPPPRPLPRRKAWLLRLAPETASGASQLRHFLADPELAPLLAADPRLGRILRPLCHALGIRAGGIRAAAIRPAKAAPPPDVAPPPSPPSPFQQRHALPEPLATPPLWHERLRAPP